MENRRRQKIYLNGRFLTQRVTGVQRYANEVLNAFDELIQAGAIDSSRYSLCLLTPPAMNETINLKNISVKKVGRFKGHMWEQLELPYHARDGYLLSLCNTGPSFMKDHFVTIHDASVFAVPQAYSFFFRLWYMFLLKRLGKTAEKIITDSEFSKKELKSYCGIKDSKIEVVYLGREHVLKTDAAASILDKHGLHKKGYVLAVGSINPNKNFNSVVRAMEIIGERNFDLAIAGGADPKVFRSESVKKLDRVKHIGYVSNSELIALYQNAACLVYPSFYEGFGLPPLEAMTCGCPVIAAETSSLPEVCGDAAIYCNPHIPEDIADKIKMVMRDQGMRDSMQEKGWLRCRNFSWEKCASETWSIIKGAIHH